MNERIRELEMQADEWSKYNYTWTPTGNNWVEVYMEKFAELIVQECLEQIYSVTIDNPTDDWDQGYDSGLNAAAETIKTHFGV